MDILKELPKREFLKKFRSHRDFKYFSGRRTKHCYRVALTKSEYMNLGMNSSPLNRYPKRGKFPRMKEALKQYLRNPHFFTETHPDRGISGTTVKKYLGKFRRGMRLANCFITDDPNAGTGKKRAYYICEGMHRLCAYGLFRKESVKDYSVRVYYHTNRRLARD